jgi:hypothetical protein
MPRRRRGGDAADRPPAGYTTAGPGHEGRGGWSWYTGAAACMVWAAYGLLGIELRNGALYVSPAEASAFSSGHDIRHAPPGDRSAP